MPHSRDNDPPSTKVRSYMPHSCDNDPPRSTLKDSQTQKMDMNQSGGLRVDFS